MSMKKNNQIEETLKNNVNGFGVIRVIKATRCSILGLKAAYKYESAFRQELWLCVLLMFISFYVAKSGMQLALLLGPLLLLLLVEVINSAIEAIVDRIGIEHHELSGRAKDLGSAAVFIAICICAVSWGCILFDNYSIGA